MDKRKRRLLCMLEGSGWKSRWISGAPPLSFKALAEGTLENYRIYGNTVGGESVGDLVTSGEHAGEYKVPVTVSNGTDTLTTPIYLPEQIRKVGDEAEYIDYGERKQHRVRKNLLPNTATSQTINGVTFTVNSDGSVTCNTDENGATATTRFYLVGSTGTDFKKLNINANAIITGCPHGGNVNTYALFILRKNDDMDPSYYNTLAETGSGLNLVYNETNKYVIFINISTGTICDNLTFYPMLRKADIEDDTYEPYIENVDLDVTLPALPTIAGSNVLTVGTEVQPSEIEVKGKIKAL